MIRVGLLAAVFALPGASVGSEELHVPGLSPDAGTDGAPLPPCELTGRSDSCVPTLACIGSDGLWFNGQARGFGEGSLFGHRSDGVICVGTWAYGGLLGSATARMECTDGITARVIYYAQDPATGTGLARGMDSTGRHVRAWTGNNVLRYLGEGDAEKAKLPCTDAPIPLS